MRRAGAALKPSKESFDESGLWLREETLCAGCLEPLRSQRYPQWGNHCYREKIKLVQVLRQSLWQSRVRAVSPDPRMSRGSCGTSHLITNSSLSLVQSAGRCEVLLGSLLLLADLPQLALPDAELSHQQADRVPRTTWNQHLCYHDNNINWSKDR